MSGWSGAMVLYLHRLLLVQFFMPRIGLNQCTSQLVWFRVCINCNVILHDVTI